NLGLIIIDEEHETTYKQQSRPYYHARDVAKFMVDELGGKAKLVLGSATPSFESLHACSKNECVHIKMNKRPTGQNLPSVQIVDMAQEFSSGSKFMFSKVLRDAINDNIIVGNKSILFLNKRGFASFILCRECGFVPECDDCSTSLTYHEYGHKLVCHHCGHEEVVPAVCPKCGSVYIRKFGGGTQRLELELKQHLVEDVEIIRMDADTTKTKGAHEKLLSRFASTSRAILLGTQMITKGLDFADVTLVGVINADSTLNIPDFRSPERAYAQLEQVSGRCGRGEMPGKVIIQTYMPSSPAIQAARCHNPQNFITEDLEGRKLLFYPPFSNLCNIVVKSKSQSQAKKYIYELANNIGQVVDARKLQWKICGPVSCTLEKLKGDYRFHILIKAKTLNEFEFNEVLLPILKKHKLSKGLQISIDVDPYFLQ
ncbi:MAG: primosomal protein N', partial [Coriobacteriales bacterium]|nr:primosomal protein N' [Coriobacteriales bacterium]